MSGENKSILSLGVRYSGLKQEWVVLDIGGGNTCRILVKEMKNKGKQVRLIMELPREVKVHREPVVYKERE